MKQKSCLNLGIRRRRGHPASYPQAWHACWLQQALAQEKQPGHIQVAIFPELFLIHLDPISCQPNVDSAFSLFLPPTPPAASSLAQVPTPSALSSSQGILPASARQVSSQTIPVQSSLSVKHDLDRVIASSETVSVFHCFLD